MEGRSFNDLLICVQSVLGCIVSSVVGWGKQRSDIACLEIEEELVTTIALLALGVPAALHLRLVSLN